MMSSSYLDSFPIDSLTLHAIPLLALILLLVEFCFHSTFGWVRKNCNSCSTSDSPLQDPPGLFDVLNAQVKKLNHDSNLPSEPKTEEVVEDGSLHGEEVEMVMKSLGIFCQSEQMAMTRVCPSDVFNLFEEKEPILDEVKEAFDVFDENRDGFICARELQRVLCALGITGDRSELENCERMIAAFDENGDGRIDFNEFAKFMENSFC